MLLSEIVRIVSYHNILKVKMYLNKSRHEILLLYYHIYFMILNTIKSVIYLTI